MHFEGVSSFKEEMLEQLDVNPRKVRAAHSITMHKSLDVCALPRVFFQIDYHLHNEMLNYCFEIGNYKECVYFPVRDFVLISPF